MSAPARGLAVVEEGALDVIELGIVLGRPIKRRGQARSAVQVPRVAAARRPLLRRATQVAVKPPAFSVLFQPAAQPRPLAQQRLVRDLDLARADREQAAVGELGQHGPSALAELLEPDPRADRRVAAALARQA